VPHRIFQVIAEENAAELSRLVSDDSGLIHARDEAYRTPLHAASAAGFGTGVDTLLLAQAPVNAMDDNRRTPAFYAACGNYGDIVQRLLASDAAVTVTDRNGRSLLHAAAGSGNPEITRLLLDAGANVDARAVGAATPLHYAAIAGDQQSARMLLDAGADANMICNEEITPLWWAIRQDDVEMVALLLAAGSSPNYKNYTGLTPLALAVCRGNDAIVRDLIDAGADPTNRQPETGRTLMHLAALHGHPAIETLLESAALDPHSLDTCGETPAVLSQRYGHSKEQVSGEIARSAAPSIRYLGGSGWLVHTEEHIVLFDPPQRGRIPSTASLRSGWIMPSDLAGKRALCFISRPSPGWLPSQLRSEAATLEGTTFVLPFEPRLDVQTRVVSPGNIDEIGGVRILPLDLGAPRPGVSYAISVDGLTIIHLLEWSYRNPSFGDALESTLKAIEGFSPSVDVALVDVPGGRKLICLSAWEALFKALRALSPRVAIPMGHLHAEHAYLAGARDINRQLPGQTVATVTAPGDTLDIKQ